VRLKIGENKRNIKHLKANGRKLNLNGAIQLVNVKYLLSLNIFTLLCSTFFPTVTRKKQNLINFVQQQKAELMDKTTLDNTKDLIAKDFELETVEDDSVTEEQLLEMLAERMDFLIQNRTEFLFSLMYRLDVDERKVEAAMHPLAPEPPHIGLAKLVLERQKQRAFTKQYYKQDKLDDMDW
jgi:hypothetical protein